MCNVHKMEYNIVIKNNQPNIHNNIDDSPNDMPSKKQNTLPETIYTIGFHFYELLDQVKLIFGEEIPEQRIPLWRWG